MQGSEADIVVLVTSRSNAHGSVGFLSMKNRMNVALSRSRQALILVGDATVSPPFISLSDLDRNSRVSRNIVSQTLRCDDLWRSIIDAIHAERLIVSGAVYKDSAPLKQVRPQRVTHSVGRETLNF